MDDVKSDYGRVAQFLAKNAISSRNNRLPYVHSTKSSNLNSIIKNSRLEAANCKVFNEELLYFFRGRPAYRESSDGEEASFWQLPTCFVYDNLPTTKIARLFPFDSGAFEAGLYPKYISMFPREAFEVRGVDSSDRIIEAYFGDIRAYVEGKAKSAETITEEYDLSVLDAEILALQRLAKDGTPKRFDDRRFTVEIQAAESVDLLLKPPSAVILPLPYYEHPFVRAAMDKWGALPLTYDVHSLSLELYYWVIFQKFREYCRKTGIDV